MSKALLQIGWLVLAVVALVTSVAAQREKSVVMPAREYPWIEGGREASTWEPSKVEIVEMESNFDKLAHLKPDHDCCQFLGSFTFDPEAYYMQYAAIFLDGHPYIFINGFRELKKGWVDGWQKEWVTAKGGGHNFWYALYDPTAKTFSRLNFNAAE